MSELKAHRIDNIISAYKIGKAFCMKTEEEVYLKSEADKVIAELKVENERLKAENKGLKDENERLKKCEIWMKQHFYCEEVIACESAKNRQLKRALWLARAERAKDNAIRYGIYGPAIKSLLWSGVDAKCRAKAEEYK